MGWGRIKYILKAWMHFKTESQYFKYQLDAYEKWFNQATKEERDKDWVEAMYNSKPFKPTGKMVKYIQFNKKPEGEI